jgi:hypothetical protein
MPTPSEAATTKPLGPRQLEQERQTRRYAMRRISKCCTAAAKTLARRAESIERTASKARAKGKVEYEAVRRRKAKDLQRVVAVLADIGASDGIIDLVAMWNKPSKFASRIARPRAAK